MSHLWRRSICILSRAARRASARGAAGGTGGGTAGGGGGAGIGAGSTTARAVVCSGSGASKSMRKPASGL